MFRKLLIALALMACATVAHAAKNRPDGYVTICKIGQTCSVSGSTNVAFGAADRFVFKVLSGTFTCSVATFGSDPNPSKSVKECSIPQGGSGGSSGGSDSGSSSSGSSGGGGSGSSGSQCGSGNGTTVCLTANGGGSINLSWSVSGTVTDIQIFRDTDASPSGRVRIASLSPSARSYTDSSAGSGTYYYWVKFRAGNGSYYNSGVASASKGSTGGGGGNNGGSGGNNNSRRSACSSSAGTVSVSSTIRVSGNYDGGCRTFVATYGDGSQSEGQDPVFRLEAGATLRNVIVGNNGDGVHIYGNATVENVSWPDVGEDALTVKDDANVNIRNIHGGQAADKFFQLNARTTFRVDNCTIDTVGKVVRENGGKCYPVDVVINNCDIRNVNEAVFRSDCSNSSFRLTNSSTSNVKTICYSGGSYRSCGAN